MLEFDLYSPEVPADGAPVIVLLHGRGADRRDLAGVKGHFPPEAILVTPQAPFPAAPWGYGPGWAWYRLAAPLRPEPESFEAGQRELEAFLLELPRRLPVQPGPLVLGGFSQGGTMSLVHALRNPGTVQFVLNFSGFLPDTASTRVTPESVAGSAFFWGHGMQDPLIPFELALEGRRRLLEAGAALLAREYPIGHGIDPEELRDAVTWLEQGIMRCGEAGV
ncbi:MAG: hypothetical protein HY704_06810 [Gemmatimonadetes bacterium]|nr:hypothetical protein [Gemmatimonadota bacterium]